MQFPSIQYLASQTINSLRRFYLPLAFALLGTYSAILLTGHNPLTKLFLPMFLACTLGLPATLGAVLLGERTAKPLLRWLPQVLAVGLTWAYWVFLAPDDWDQNYSKLIMYLVLTAVMHLWVAIAPYLGHKQKTGFWQYNESLYSRILLSLLFSGVIYIGLALALAACEKLFGYEPGHYIYEHMFFCVMGVFNTWFFMAGIPSNFEQLNESQPYPRSLKVFTQYILIPLILLYMLILYAYGMRIIVSQHWPTGWVSVLIMSYSVAGILAILLTNPLQGGDSTKWAYGFSRLFFIGSLPLMALLYAAAWVRVRSYGITEPRYVLLVLGAWLGCISLYFIFSRSRDIRLIPVSLAILGLLSLFGPWGMFHVSSASQRSHMERILTKNKAWTPGGKKNLNTVAIRQADFDELRSIINYFIRKNDLGTIQKFYNMDLKELSKTAKTSTALQNKGSWEAEDTLRNVLLAVWGKDSLSYPEIMYADKYCHIGEHNGFEIEGFSQCYNIEFNSYKGIDSTYIRLPNSDSITAVLYTNDTIVTISYLKDSTLIGSVNLTSLVSNLRIIDDGSNVPEKDMTLMGTGKLKSKLVVRSVRVMTPREHLTSKIISGLEVSILIK